MQCHAGVGRGFGCSTSAQARPLTLGPVARIAHTCMAQRGSRPCSGLRPSSSAAMRQCAAKAFGQSMAAQQETEVPPGYGCYETMIILRPDMTEEERDMELAKFEAYLKQHETLDISALVRGSQRLAYPIKGFWDGVYVLYTYTAKRSTSQGVQKLLSKPAIGGDTSNILRHMTFVR